MERVDMVDWEVSINASQRAQSRMVEALIVCHAEFVRGYYTGRRPRNTLIALVRMAPADVERFREHTRAISIVYRSPRRLENGGSYRAIYDSPDKEIWANQQLAELNRQMFGHGR
jgi:hypothetical protein